MAIDDSDIATRTLESRSTVVLFSVLVPRTGGEPRVSVARDEHQAVLPAVTMRLEVPFGLALVVRVLTLSGPSCTARMSIRSTEDEAGRLPGSVRRPNDLGSTAISGLADDDSRQSGWSRKASDGGWKVGLGQLDCAVLYSCSLQSDPSLARLSSLRDAGQGPAVEVRARGCTSTNISPVVRVSGGGRNQEPVPAAISGVFAKVRNIPWLPAGKRAARRKRLGSR